MVRKDHVAVFGDDLVKIRIPVETPQAPRVLGRDYAGDGVLEHEVVIECDKRNRAASACKLMTEKAVEDPRGGGGCHPIGGLG